MTATESTLLWEPDQAFKVETNFQHYLNWLRGRGLEFETYPELWEWSVSDLSGFWTSVWDYFSIKASKPFASVLTHQSLQGAAWFSGAELNYAEHIFRHQNSTRSALSFQSELQPLTEITWKELYQSVASFAAVLRQMNVRPGDRIVSYMPNIPETIIAFLACASLGAIWSGCSPDFGSPSVIDRFRQIEPTILLAADGYRYNGKDYDRRQTIAEIQKNLPTLKHTILVPYLDKNAGPGELVNVSMWGDLLTDALAELVFHQVPFDQPLWVLYSSGTTGLPKAIVQSHGGILLEHLKTLSFHLDWRPEDRIFWFTTTGWMMWNFLVGGLLLGATVVLFDGCPTGPGSGTLWKLAEQAETTFFGASAAFFTASMKEDIKPSREYDLSKIRGIGTTGSPLPPEAFQWVYENVKADVWLSPISGGTDLCTAFVGGCPLLPVYAGEMQCRFLGANVRAFDEQGGELIEEVGELVIIEPMPSMPLYFWNDQNDRRYHETYFAPYPGIWRHGDWIKITKKGSVIIYGRSDSTINRMGVRMGTSEFYRVIEELPEVLDSLVLDVDMPDGKAFMPLFLVLKEGVELNELLKKRVRAAIACALSPRHIPDEIFVVSQVPRTLSGKKLEVPIKRILMGTPPQRALSMDSLRNPASVEYFIELSSKLRKELG